MRSSKRRLIISVLLLLIIMLVTMAFVHTVLTVDYHDDPMYLTASVLTSTGEWPYFDFPYLQMPYLPLLYGAIFSLTGLSYVYLQAQILTFLSFLLFLVGWCFFARVVGLNWITTLLTTVIILSFSYFQVPLFAVSNWVWELVGLIWTWGFFAWGIYHDRKLGFFGAGIVSGLTVGFRLTALFWMPVFLIMSWFLIQNRKEKILRYLGGWILGLLPALFLFIQDPSRFFFYNLNYHLVNTEWYQLVGTRLPMTWLEKFLYFVEWMLRWEHLLLEFGVLLALLLFWKRRQTLDHGRRLAGVTVLILIVVLLLVALRPSPIHKQYFLTFALALFFIGPVIFAGESLNSDLGTVMLFALFGVLVIHSFWMFGPLIPRAMDPGNWPAIVTHRINMKIESKLTAWNLDGPVLTLAPVYLAETPHRIVRPLATGIFLYRSGGLLTNEKREKFRVISDENLHQWIQKIRPSAVVFTHGDVDRKIKQWVLTNQSVRREFQYGSPVDPQLFVGPFRFDQK